MKLKTIEVTEFKSVRSSGEVEIEDITCLVGKNEAGKTALLQALYRLNPVVPEDADFSVTHDYPRVDVEDYQQAIEAKEREPATVIRAEFELEPDDLADIEADYGAGVVTPKLVLSKGYGNVLEYELETDETVAVNHLIAQAQLEGEATLKGVETLGDLAAKAAELAKPPPAPSEEADPQPDPQEETRKQAEKLVADVATVRPPGLAERIWGTYIEPRLPKFLYFDEYFQMEGSLNVEALRRRQQANELRTSDRPMLGLVELARLNVDKLATTQNTQDLVNKLEGASNHLSKQVLKYWSQNKHLQMKFDLRPALPQDPEGMREGNNLWANVHDSVHMVTTGVGVRSKGFIWFFSFLAYFSQQRKSGKPDGPSSR
jgi:hypothetical protein